MKEKTILIVGLGLIGGSIAKALSAFTPHHVIGMDRDPEVLDQAIACGAIERIGYAEDLPFVDVLWLCLYPNDAVDFVRSYGDRVSNDCIITDTCGIKNAICPQMIALSKRFQFHFVGGHPMAGKERNGFDVSEATLFRQASYLLVPCEAPQWAADTMADLAKQIGFAEVVWTTPEHHDEMIAYTSQLAHVVSSAYIKSELSPKFKGFSAGSFHDMTRVAKLNETMWTELFLQNKDYLAEEIDGLIARLQSYSDVIQKGDAKTLQEMLKDGKQKRLAVDDVKEFD